MSRFLIAASLAALLGLAGCAGFPSENFACAPSVGLNHVDRTLYTVPSTVGPDGYHHC